MVDRNPQCAQTQFLYITSTLREEPLVIFTASGLLAISFCIDSFLKAIDFDPTVCVCEGGEREKDGASLP